MRFPISMAALIGACLLAAPAHAAPASAIKDFVLPTHFGDSAPIIKVQRVMNPDFSNQNPPAGQRSGGAAPRQGGQQQGVVQRQGGQRQGGQQFNRGGGGNRGDGYRGDRHRNGGDDGAGVAAGVLGGLLLGAVIANESQRNQCSRRPGYDPRSQTFVGSDHRRYRCP
jgi:hypothetical protein